MAPSASKKHYWGLSLSVIKMQQSRVHDKQGCSGTGSEGQSKADDERSLRSWRARRRYRIKIDAQVIDHR